MWRKAILVIFLVSVGLAVDRGDAPMSAVASTRQPSGEFSFVRLIYSGGNDLDNWTTDFPKADRQLVLGLRRISNLDYISPEPRQIAISDPELFKYPYCYAVEVCQMRLSDSEAKILREYLLRGGFLEVDDFHGEAEWQSFMQQMKKVFPDPEYNPVDLPASHPIFHCFYDINTLIQIPGLQYLYTGSLSEKGGTVPHYRAILAKDGRIMVMINHNSDLGDAWEWADDPAYSSLFATRAFQLATNYIVYSMTH